MANNMSAADVYFGRRRHILSVQENLNRRMLRQRRIENLRAKAA